jgi:hypothetical protein
MQHKYQGLNASMIANSSLHVKLQDPTGRFSGYNISDATIYRLDESSFILPLDPIYTENVKYSVNVGVVLWNLDQNVKDYTFAQNVDNQLYRGFREYYDIYMADLDESERIEAWNIFESRRCAYDMELPTITSFEVDGTGYNLTLSATDNVGIAKVEWYVNDVLHASLPINDSSVVTSLDLSALVLAPGQRAFVTCHVYDLEGVQTGDRPRLERFVWRGVDVTIPGIRSLAYPLYDHYMDENMQKISQEDVLMEMGDSVTLHADLDGNEELLLFTDTIYQQDITVQRPDGSISLHTREGLRSFDHPLVIPVDMAGTWNVTITDMMNEELYEEMQAYTPQEFLRKDADFSKPYSLRLASRPTAVELDLPETTYDPYLLSQIVAQIPGTVVVTENGERLSLSQPLADGKHNLNFKRVASDGRVSSVTNRTLVVDTLTPNIPEITLGDVDRVTNAPYIWLELRLSDNVMDFYINGKRYNCSTGRWTTLSVPSKRGEDQLKLRAVSFAGYETERTATVRTVETVPRQGEVPEYVVKYLNN